MHRFVPSLALALILAACGGGAAAPASSTTAPSPATSASAKPATSAAASAKPAASGAASASAKPAASGGAIPSIPAGQKVKIVTATGVPSVVFTPMWIAADTGLFAKYGLDAELQNIEGVKQATAMIAGDVQIGNVGGAEILNSQANNAKMIAIEETTASPLFEIHADPSITKVEDLRGKTIAITQNGSSTDMATRVLVRNHGLDPDKDVKLLNAANMPGIVAAMVSKNTQAGTVSPPTTIKATAAGFPRVASAIDEHVPLQNNLVATMKPYADQHPEIVYAYLKAILEANKVYLDQPDVAITAIAKHTDSDQATAKAAYDAMKPALEQVGVVQEAGLKTIQDYAPNPKVKTVNLKDAYDNRFIDQLKSSGFTTQLGLK